MLQRVIILRGAPASGKTTIAKSYRNFNEKVAWLKVDNFKDFFAEDATPALEYVNGSAVATLDYLIGQGFSVVVDGVFQNTIPIDEILELAKKQNIPAKVFELTTSLKTLQKRDVLREGVPEGLRKPLGNETIENIFTTLENNPYPNSVEINTKNNSTDKCKELIDEAFN